MIQDLRHRPPRIAAKELLRQLSRASQDASGNPPSPEQFYPVNPEALITSVLGWKLNLTRFVSTFDPDLLAFCDFEEKEIRLNAGIENLGERRFTLAHELAHALLHDGSGYECTGGAPRVKAKRRTKFTPDPRVLSREREADIFATELLMPEKAVRNHFQRLFSVDHLWVHSPAIQRHCVSEHQRRRNEPLTPMVVARMLSDAKGGGQAKSLVEFFGVSHGAMARRLVELSIVH